jgi:hypothetical protein
MSIEGVSAVPSGTDFSNYETWSELSGPAAGTDPPRIDSPLAGRDRDQQYFVTRDDVQRFIDGAGATLVNSLFKDSGITNRRDQQMVSGLAFLSTSPRMPAGVKAQARDLLLNFIAAQDRHRASGSAQERADWGTVMGAMRSDTWSFLDRHIYGADGDQMHLPLAPIREKPPANI